MWSELGLVGYDVCLTRRRSRVRFSELVDQEKWTKIGFAWMSFSGEECRLQICRGLIAQWFNSTFCAMMLIEQCFWGEMRAKKKR